MWLPQPCLLRGPKEGVNATSPLHSRGSPTPGVGSKIRSGHQQRGIKSEVAASPLPSRGPKGGRKCYITPAFSGIPNNGEQNQKWVHHSYLLGDPQSQTRGAKSNVAASPLPSQGPKTGRKCYVSPAFLGVPNAKRGEQNQEWSPTKGEKIGSGCLTPAFSGAQKRTEMLCHPCILGGPERQGWAAKLGVVANKGE